MKKKYSVITDLKRALFQGLNEDKQSKIQDRVVQYIFKDDDIPKQVNRLEEVTVYLEKIYWNKKETKDFSETLLKKISEAALNKRLIKFFLRIYAMTRSGDEVASSRCLTLKNGQYSAKELKTAAMLWFVTEFLQYVALNLENSLKFALLLLEDFNYFIKSSVENVDRFLSIIRDRGSIGKNVTSYEFILCSAVNYSGKSFPQKKWLDVLISSLKDNPAVKDVLNSIINIITLLVPDGKFEILESNSEDDAYNFFDLLINGEKGIPDIFHLMFKPVLRLPNEHRSAFLEWRKQEDIIFKSEIKEGKLVLDWFSSHEDDVDKLLDAKCFDIIKGVPLRGLRPGGADHIDIKLIVLRNVGIRSVAFYPNGCDFPNVKIKLMIRAETPHLVVYNAFINVDGDRLKLNIHPHILGSIRHSDMGEIRKIFEFVIIDIMHRIIVEDRELRLKPKNGNGKSVSEIGNKTVPVRPHYRKLNQNQKPSQKAQTLGKETFGWNLPSGVTFVTAHYRGGNQFVYDMPNEPIMIYSEDDLREAGVLI